MPDLKAVKHEVKDSEAHKRTHPVFDPMLEQFERFTQMIQRLRQRKVLVRLPDREKVHRVRVPKVPGSRVSGVQLEKIKHALTKAVGTPYTTLEQQIIERAKLHGVPLYIQQSKTPESEEHVWQ